MRDVSGCREMLEGKAPSRPGVEELLPDPSGAVHCVRPSMVLWYWYETPSSASLFTHPLDVLGFETSSDPDSMSLGPNANPAEVPDREVV